MQDSSRLSPEMLADMYIAPRAAIAIGFLEKEKIPLTAAQKAELHLDMVTSFILSLGTSANYFDAVRDFLERERIALDENQLDRLRKEVNAQVHTVSGVGIKLMRSENGDALLAHMPGEGTGAQFRLAVNAIATMLGEEHHVKLTWLDYPPQAVIANDEKPYEPGNTRRTLTFIDVGDACIKLQKDLAKKLGRTPAPKDLENLHQNVVIPALQNRALARKDAEARGFLKDGAGIVGGVGIVVEQGEGYEMRVRYDQERNLGSPQHFEAAMRALAYDLDLPEEAIRWDTVRKQAMFDVLRTERIGELRDAPGIHRVNISPGHYYDEVRAVCRGLAKECPTLEKLLAYDKEISEERAEENGRAAAR